MPPDPVPQPAARPGRAAHGSGTAGSGDGRPGATGSGGARSSPGREAWIAEPDVHVLAITHRLGRHVTLHDSYEEAEKEYCAVTRNGRRALGRTRPVPQAA